MNERTFPVRLQHLVILLLGAYGLTYIPAAVAESPHTVFDEQYRDFFTRYCVECHKRYEARRAVEAR